MTREMTFAQQPVFYFEKKRKIFPEKKKLGNHKGFLEYKRISKRIRKHLWKSTFMMVGTNSNQSNSQVIRGISWKLTQKGISNPNRYDVLSIYGGLLYHVDKEREAMGS